jgi:hypothetical protein
VSIVRRAGPAWVLALVLAPALAAAQGAEQAEDPSAVRSGTATRVEVAPVIDGRLDEPAWLEAEPLTAFVQHEPLAGTPASERTEVRVLFDDDALYIGVWMYDAEPDRIITGERRRNADLRQSDAFLVVLDTYQDRQNGFVFGTNPGSIEYDGQVRGGQSPNTNWDGAWNVATSRDHEGWYAEFRIPFSTLRYGPGEQQTWGLNMARYIGRKNEQVFWSPVPRQFDFYRLTEAGLLRGIEPPPQRVTTLTPYVLSAAQRIPPMETGTTYPFEVGADAKVGITPSLSLDVTVNTDFAQVEVDDQQVDLTRFSLFFPERRPFFLENEELFRVGGRSGPGRQGGWVQMFHSRRIGVADGQEVPIGWGGRVSGRAGGMDVGFLHMRTDGLEGLQAPTGWTVARLARELPNRSRVGGIFTSRVSSDDREDFGRTYALDGRVGIGDEWTLSGVVALSESPGVDDEREVYLFSADYRSRDWQVTTSYEQIGENFRPDVGFLRRSGFRESEVRVMRYLRLPGVERVRELRPHVRHTISHDFSGFKETQVVHMHTHVEFESGGLVMPALDWMLDGLSEPFRIPGTDIDVPPGTYSGWTLWSSYRTNPAATVSFSSRQEIGSFLSGDRRALSGGITVRRGSTLSGDVDVSHNRIRLEEGRFNTTLSRLRLRYAFSPALSLQSTIQYSDQTGEWTGNVRFGWLDTAGTGLFVVYNERQTFEDVVGVSGMVPRGTAEPSERTFVVKFTRQLDLSRLTGNAGG